ncbi:hypothetical protein Rhow_004603 [Rhodococcus wratislaviensis]|uniref:Uncharacterized protein n=1 Tax=Rhodococcus wratislaviensis TaxID=44752 RepID=A0A402CBE8_RHOWR|nr:hypothetical protein Rhow_004603 [Rhodococcus wratislaviensis]
MQHVERHHTGHSSRWIRRRKVRHPTKSEIQQEVCLNFPA